ncbi:MAG: hypothetical protein AB7E95_11710 [Kiritimatiellales bacterium]
MHEFIYCRMCGARNPENNYKCTQCGFELHPPNRPDILVADDNTLGGLIPYKNVCALWSYYLGVFSLLPLLGIAPGIAAVILGCRGITCSRRHPELRGRVHAWVGLVLGSLCAAGNVTAIILVVRLLTEY